MTPAEHSGTGSCAWPVPGPAGTARALAGISGDIARGLPPKTGDALIFLAAVRAAGTAPGLGPDQPIPFSLTSKALAALDSGTTATAMDCGCGPDDCAACAGSGWACLRCGDAFFGTAPDDGLCPPCRAPRAVPGRTRP
jgi:hypothetical protein